MAYTKKTFDGVRICIHDASVEETPPPPLDEVVACSERLAAELVQKWPKDLAIASKKKRGGIMLGRVKRVRFKVSADEGQLAAAIAAEIKATCFITAQNG